VLQPLSRYGEAEHHSQSHIAVFIHSQGWKKGQKLELFMIPNDGTLRPVKGFGLYVQLAFYSVTENRGRIIS
jgi:hypothetical protein